MCQSIKRLIANGLIYQCQPEPFINEQFCTVAVIFGWPKLCHDQNINNFCLHFLWIGSSLW
jgi:hypothetical protein